MFCFSFLPEQGQGYIAAAVDTAVADYIAAAAEVDIAVVVAVAAAVDIAGAVDIALAVDIAVVVVPIAVAPVAADIAVVVVLVALFEQTFRSASRKKSRTSYYREAARRNLSRVLP